MGDEECRKYSKKFSDLYFLHFSLDFIRVFEGLEETEI